VSIYRGILPDENFYVCLGGIRPMRFRFRRIFGNEVNGKDIEEYRLFGFYQHFIKYPKMMAIFILHLYIYTFILTVA